MNILTATEINTRAFCVLSAVILSYHMVINHLFGQQSKRNAVFELENPDIFLKY